MLPAVAPRITRRQMLRGLGCCAIGAAGVDAVGCEPRWLEVTHHDVPVPGLATALHGYRVAQLSDLHLSSLGHLHDRLLEELRAIAPQLIALTGDVIEDRLALPVAASLCDALARITPRVLATLGNWEHWGEVPLGDLAATYARTGALLVDNERVRLDPGLDVIAVGDACSGHADEHRALDGLTGAGTRLLLTHAPEVLDRLPASARIALGLAGHTHGGQVRAGGALWVPPGSGRFRAGMYETAAGPAYVSRGIGTSVLGVRFLCRPELAVFRLVQG
jgi:uncharacterized protein